MMVVLLDRMDIWQKGTKNADFQTGNRITERAGDAASRVQMLLHASYFG